MNVSWYSMGPNTRTLYNSKLLLSILPEAEMALMDLKH